MVIDSSALVAILLEEQEASQFIELISDDSHRLVSTLSFVETSIVIGNRFGQEHLAELDGDIVKSGVRDKIRQPSSLQNPRSLSPPQHERHL